MRYSGFSDFRECKIFAGKLGLKEEEKTILILVGSEARKNRSGSDCGGNGLIGKGIDLRVEDSGCGEFSFGDDKVDC